MKRSIAWIVTGLLFSGLLSGCAVSKPGPKSNNFFGLTLGQAPTTDMVCVRGSCVEDGNPLKVRTRSVQAIYTRIKDVTHWGPVQITSPRYSFHNKQLFRIFFRLDCERGTATANMTAIVDHLRSWGPFPHSEPLTVNQGGVQIDGLWLWNDQGLVANIERRKHGEKRWERPSVEIYDASLMDAVRTANNPNYPELKKKMLQRQKVERESWANHQGKID